MRYATRKMARLCRSTRVRKASASPPLARLTAARSVISISDRLDSETAKRLAMRDIGRILILCGVVFVVLGLLVTVAPRIGIGRLPGDIVYRRGNFTLYLPLMTSLLLSIALTILLWIFRR